MIRLLKIELKKIVRYKPFWVMTGLYVFFFIFLCFVYEDTIRGFIQGFERGNTQTQTQTQTTNEKFYEYFSAMKNYPNIWVHISNLAFFFKFLIAIVMVMLVCNEYQYRTLKQNFIDGMSRKEIILGKELVIVIISLISTILMVLLVLILGNNRTSETNIFQGSYIVFLYFLAMIFYLNIVYFLSTLIKKSGFTILILLLYGFVEGIVSFLYKPIADYLPYHVIDSIIPSTLETLKNNNYHFSIEPKNIVIAVLYLILSIFGNYYLLKKRSSN